MLAQLLQASVALSVPSPHRLQVAPEGVRDNSHDVKVQWITRARARSLKISTNGEI